MSQVTQIISDHGKAVLKAFEDFIEVVTGRKSDIKGRHELFTRPETPETSTNLNANEVSMMAGAMYISDQFPIEWRAMARFAHEYSRASLSKNGFAVEKSIESYQLNNEKGALGKLGIIKQEITEKASE